MRSRLLNTVLRRATGALFSLWTALLLAACSSDATTSPTPTPTPVVPIPALAREFRGLWIATVGNIDWPSSSSLSKASQQAELTQILDLAKSSGLNAIVLQVRASGDALFPSSLEPWSRALSGTQGVDPGWDPLAFAVQEAHARGLELHAWFNPFRAGNLSDTNRLAASHFAKRRPDVVRVYCSQLWFDPGEQAVQDQAIAVMRDVAERYDVDAVHIDDFFYPYPDTKCPSLDFPDSATYARYTQNGGTLVRGDWRRDNVNRFVQRLYTTVHSVRPTARVGISPFGIWRPGNPSGITGLDAYGSIYADSRYWLQQGWLDYFAPQLYWSIASTGQSFPALLDWWMQQNTLKRHLWPGLAAYRVSDGSSSPYAASEIGSQLSMLRQRANAASATAGALLYNTSVLQENRGGLATLLSTSAYASPALAPATPWLDASPPSPPTIAVDAGSSSGTARVRVSNTAAEPVLFWVLRWRSGAGTGDWSQRTVGASSATVELPVSQTAGSRTTIVVNALDRVGNASDDVIWRSP